MNHLFQILGIDATDDIEVVKRAYYKKLQTTDEDDTLAMSKIHDAYNRLSKYLAHKAAPTASFGDSTIEFPKKEQAEDKFSSQFHYQEPESAPVPPLASIYKDAPYTEPIHALFGVTVDKVTSEADLLQIIYLIVKYIGQYQEPRDWQNFIKQVHDLYTALNLQMQVFFRAELSTHLHDSAPIESQRNMLQENLKVFRSLDLLYAYKFITFEELKQLSMPTLLLTNLGSVTSLDGSKITIEKPRVAKPNKNTGCFRLLIALVIIVGAIIMFFTIRDNTSSTPKPPTYVVPNYTPPKVEIGNNVSTLKTLFYLTNDEHFDQYSDDEKQHVSDLKTSITNLFNKETPLTDDELATLKSKVSEYTKLVNNIEARFADESENN